MKQFFCVLGWSSVIGIVGFAIALIAAKCPTFVIYTVAIVGALIAARYLDSESGSLP
jgi:hypothetical protein